MANIDTNITFRKTINGVDTIVTLGLTAFKESIMKKIASKLTPPQSSSNYGDGPKDTKILYLLQIETAFVVDCEIIESLQPDSAYSLTDTNSTAINKLIDLKNILTAGGNFTIYVKGTSYSVNLDGKCDIDDVFNDKQTSTTDEIAFTVKMTLLKGINMIGGNS